MTQYFLSVKSSSPENTTDNGTGWYDSDGDAHSISTLGAFTNLQSFDWNGTIPSGQVTETSGTIKMNGPKEILAIWKFDFGYLGAILGAGTVALTIFGTIHAKKHAFFSIIPKFMFWRKS